MIETNTILLGDSLELLKTMPDKCIQTCVTSPPYWGLRDYGVEGQMGLEKTPEEYVQKMVVLFREVRRVMKDDATLWLNLGDSYAGSWGNYAPTGKGGQREKSTERFDRKPYSDKKDMRPPTSNKLEGIKPKDLVGIPWMTAFALRADGYYLRQEIIWNKPNPMPESVTDRCTKSHEHIFLLTKSPQYYYDAEAIKEPVTASTVGRLKQNLDAQTGSFRVPGKTNGPMKAKRSKANSFKREGSKREQAIPGQSVGTHRPDRDESDYSLDTRNKRSVWTINTEPYAKAHFATFPPKLIVDCIKAGSAEGDLVLDPFIGAGTTALVSLRLNRKFIGCELNPEYIKIAHQRIAPYLHTLFS